MPEYLCRLVMKVEVDTPGDAAPQFVQHLVEGGLTSWIYRVEDPETLEIMGYFDGKGIPLNMDALMEAEAEDDEENDEEDDRIQMPVETLTLPDPGSMGEGLEISITTSATPDDAELLALAESLNETEKP